MKVKDHSQVRMQQFLKKLPIVLFLLVLGWFIFSFVIFPNYMVLKNTFFENSTMSMEPVKKILNSERAMKGLRNSVILAISLPITTSIIGIFQVLVLDYFHIKGFQLLRLAYFIPLIFGGIILVNGYLFVYGPRGFMTQSLTHIFPFMNAHWFNGYGAVLFIMSFSCTSNYMIFFRNSLKSIDFQTIEAAKGLGANQWTILRKVLLPTLRPMLSTCIMLLFQTGLMAMAAPLLVGGRDFETIGPLILTFSQRPSSRQLAAVLSLVLGISQIIILWIMQRSEKKGNFLSISKVKTTITKQKVANPVVSLIVHLLAYGIAIVNLLPFLSVIVFSFTDYYSISTGTISWEHLTFNNYIQILTNSNAYKPFLTSIIYSFFAAFLAVVLMLIFARLVHKSKSIFTKIFEYLIFIPWVVPGMMFAIGLVLGYIRPQWQVMNYVLTGSLFIMLIAYIVVMLPNTFRFLKASYYSVDQDLEDAAKNLGAKPFYTFMNIILPIIMPTALAMFVLNFNGKLADYDLSVFLYHPANKPLGVVIRSSATSESNIEGVALNFVYTVILMTINALVFYFIYGNGKELFSKKRNKKSMKNILKNENPVDVGIQENL